MKKRKAQHSHAVAQGFLLMIQQQETDWKQIDTYMDRMTEDDMWLTLRLLLASSVRHKEKKRKGKLN